MSVEEFLARIVAQATKQAVLERRLGAGGPAEHQGLAVKYFRVFFRVYPIQLVNL